MTLKKAFGAEMTAHPPCWCPVSQSSCSHSSSSHWGAILNERRR